MTTAVQTTTRQSPLKALAARYNIEPDTLLATLKGTVIKPGRDGKPATNEELAAFCIVADQYGLNPFLREIHAFTDGQRGIVPIVGIDGWAKIVNARGDFDGCDFEEDADPDGTPVAVTCRMYVKGRGHPVAVRERFVECKRNTPPWNTMPWRMLRHKAYMQAARMAFALSGIYDEDEARDIMRNAKVVEADPEPTDARKALAAKKVKAEPVAVVESAPPPPETEADPPPADAPATDKPEPATPAQLKMLETAWATKVKSCGRAAADLGFGKDKPITSYTFAEASALLERVQVGL